MYRHSQEGSPAKRLSDGGHEPKDWPPEKVAAVRTIRRLMEFWQIEPSELSGHPPPPPAPVVDLPPKYRHPVSGDTWDGQGHQPEWLRHALLKEGYTVEELRVPEPAA